MRRHFVQSSVFKSVGYDPRLKILELEFKDTGDVWQYSPFLKSAYRKFINAGSLGHVFSTEIRDKYHEEQVNN